MLKEKNEPQRRQGRKEKYFFRIGTDDPEKLIALIRKFDYEFITHKAKMFSDRINPGEMSLALRFTNFTEQAGFSFFFRQD